MEITPAAGHLGAVVRDVDLKSLDATEVDKLRDLIAEYLVLVFPEQHSFTDSDQVAFASHFGGPYIHPVGRANGVTEFGSARIIDDIDHPPNQDKFHTDVTWDPERPTFGCLRIVDRPERGGDTIFCSTYAAYDSLSDAMKSALENLTAWHTMGDETSFRSKAGDAAVDRVLALVPGAEHPVIAVHPVTGRRYVNVNQEFTDHIVQMTAAESRAMLEFLYAHCANPNFAMRWTWSLGDVVLWDERPTLHFAVADYYPQRREMVRVNVR